MNTKALLVATAATTFLGSVGLAQATTDNDGGPSGRLHEGRTVAAPHVGGPRFFAPYHGYRHYRHRWWQHGRWYYRY